MVVIEFKSWFDRFGELYSTYEILKESDKALLVKRCSDNDTAWAPKAAIKNQFTEEELISKVQNCTDQEKQLKVIACLKRYASHSKEEKLELLANRMKELNII